MRAAALGAKSQCDFFDMNRRRLLLDALPEIARDFRGMARAE
jgi:hypothetical protein